VVASMCSPGCGPQSVSQQGNDLCLGDVLRGSIAVAECEYTCNAMRDLLLLCIYALQSGSAMGAQADAAAWLSLRDALDEHFPSFSRLHCCIKFELPRQNGCTFQPRGCDLWASMYHAAAGNKVGRRPPPSSFLHLKFALQLVRREAWSALRWWSRHQSSKGLVAYLAGCEWLAVGRFDAAGEAFLQAEAVGAADILVECLYDCGLSSLPPAGSGPAGISYNVHVGQLFGSRGRLEDDYRFSSKAASLAESSPGCSTILRQQLWSAAFEKAVHLEMWADANHILTNIVDFEQHLRWLGQKLRSTGRIELMLQLPEKHRAFFLNSLREHASLSPPTLGSDSLACYHLLYALHFSAQEYLTAAMVACTLYFALASPLQQVKTVDISMNDSRDSLQWIQTGDCISSPLEVPKPSQWLLDGIAARAQSQSVIANTRSSDHVWPLLEQQRSSLLMLISALSLTPEKLVVLLPHQLGGRMQDSREVADGGAFDFASSNLDGLQDWFSQADTASKESTISLQDAQGLLATVEAYMVLCGRSDLVSPSNAARTVAGLGLLGLALQVARAYELDVWQFAFQPFTQLCVELENCTDDKARSLAQAAQGPAQAYMFVNSDGNEALGCEGSLSKAFWCSLEEGLRAAGELQVGEHAVCDAASARLHSLVAHEVLSLSPEMPLPRFLLRTLSAGPSWVGLLRLYMRHSRAKDAVELLGEELQLCQERQQSRDPCALSALRQFPASVAVQLRNGLREQSSREGSSGSTELVASLDTILTQLESLLEDSERRAA